MRHKDNYKYNYFYKVTNNLNGNFYYGIHSTNNIDDGYMGSGLKLKRAFKKYGIENFSKEILKFFNTRKELSDYESEIVTEDLVNNPNCYNISLGGEQLNVIGTFTAYNKDKCIWERITKEEYNLNPNKFITSPKIGFIIVKDKFINDNKWIYIKTEDYLLNKERYECVNAFKKGTILVTYKDNPGKGFTINKEDFNENIYIRIGNTFNKGDLMVKDSSGNVFKINNKDPRFLSGELKTTSVGYKWTDEQKKKLKEKFANISHQKGKNNSQFGTKWIYKDSECIKIKKEELQKYLNNGWQLGNLNAKKK